MSVFLSLFTLLALGGPGSGRLILPKSVPTDSIGQEMRGGQRFVKHRVAAGETLTALSRRYHVTLAQLTEANPQISNGLGMGKSYSCARPPAGATAAPPQPNAVRRAGHRARALHRGQRRNPVWHCPQISAHSR